MEVVVYVLVNPEVPQMMVSDCFSPQSQHSIERYEDSEEIGDHKHPLGRDLEVVLEIPKTKRAEGAGKRLC